MMIYDVLRLLATAVDILLVVACVTYAMMADSEENTRLQKIDIYLAMILIVNMFVMWGTR